MRVIAQNRSEYGQAPLDLYTPLHFGLGLVAGLLGVSPVKAALWFTVAKIAVAAIERDMGHALFRRVPGESNVNELCDLLAEIGGVDVGRQIRNGWAQKLPVDHQPQAPTPPQAPVAGIFW